MSKTLLVALGKAKAVADLTNVVGDSNLKHYRFVYKFPTKFKVYHTKPGEPAVLVGTI